MFHSVVPSIGQRRSERSCLHPLAVAEEACPGTVRTGDTWVGRTVSAPGRCPIGGQQSDHWLEGCRLAYRNFLPRCILYVPPPTPETQPHGPCIPVQTVPTNCTITTTTTYHTHSTSIPTPSTRP
ncbi:hypothetical protein EYF80_008616 [Liparis tanakae]|uniref:Uncharacterized protein n=1 Tax=Liparis tanakae TaxID=230148 RepID=A0A4Z2ISI8_9TELE|nr:hypothetical protein EYF80_008616 [Liparis tanakae]